MLNIYKMNISSLFKSDIKFVGKWMELEKNNPKCGNPDLERKLWYVFTYMYTLAVKKHNNLDTICRSKYVRFRGKD